MQVPLEFSTRELSEDAASEAERIVRNHVRKLEHMAPEMIACRVAVERPQQNQRNGNRYRVRILITIPPHKELVVTQEPGDNDPGDTLRHVLRTAFDAMRRQIKSQRQRRRGAVKNHVETLGIVVRLFPEAGYGFLKATEDGHEIYFHHNAVIHGDFDRIALGTQVRFVETLGEEGPQASTVQIIDKPGERARSRPEDETLPTTWREHRH